MTSTLQEIAGNTFDYVIIGGGTAGLALAARLAENPSISVAVLEAGEALLDDPKVLIPGQFGATLGDPKYDWFFKTTKQQYSNDQEFIWSRGKGLGGSSAMNFYAWIKPPAADIDVIEKLGNPGWNWESYLKYSKRSETFHPAIDEFTANRRHSFNPEFRGTDGPIQTTVPFLYDSLDALFLQTLDNMGSRKVEDPYGGDITGSWTVASNLDPRTWTRSYATNAYYLPAQHAGRKNLKVLTEAFVSRIVLEGSQDDGNVTATSVEFIYNGATHAVQIKKEAILCAGAVNSPQILELSGIGGREILEKIEVPVKVDLPGVGENVQDHHFVGMSWEVDPTKHLSHDILRDPEYAAEALKLHTHGKGPLRAGIGAFAYLPLSTTSKEASSVITNAHKQVEEIKAKADVVPGLAEQWALQLAALRDDTLPDLEFVVYPGFFTTQSSPKAGQNYISLALVANHPFSRGTIHATSNNPLHPPEIDPHYFEHDFDLEILVQHIKYARDIANAEPWKSGTIREVDPGPEVASDEQIRTYIKRFHKSAWHTVGSCSMLPREKRGVVDPSLKVYGTSNVRVADLSIVPLQIAAHTQATAYVIGEKAADLILGQV